MSSVFLDHHSRLGDQFIMNGAIREYCKRYNQVGIFSIPMYHEAVVYMFRDLSNLHIELAPTERSRRYFILKNFFTRRFDRMVNARGEDFETGILPELQFYKMAGIDHAKKWESFYIKRDPARENALYQKLTRGEPYIVVHKDARYPIDQSRITSTLLQVSPEKSLTENLFDYCGLFEKAAEIHAIDSSFMFLIDQLAYDNPTQKLFVHRYARPNPAFNLPILKKPWNILGEL